MGSDIGQSGARALERVTPFAWENPIGVHVKKDGKNHPNVRFDSF